MDEDRKGKLARQGMRAVELMEPGAITKKVKDAVGDAAGDVALKGVAAIGRLTGRERSPARREAAETVDLSPTFAQWEAAESEDFEARLRQAAADKARAAREERESREEREANLARRRAQRAEQRAERQGRQKLADLRRSFPKASRELALLIFNCVDLLEELSSDAEGRPPAPADLARKEQLLSRLAELLAPRSEEALKSFVAHVVQTSEGYRSALREGGEGEA